MAITGTPTEQADFLLGTSGPDTIDGLGGDDEILGLAGADNLIGGAGDDSIDGGTENDTIEGGLGQDTLSGGDGDDALTDTGGSSFGYLFGEAGSDNLQVNSGYAQLLGGDDNDTLTATGTSFVYLLGEAGSDSLQVNSGYGYLYGGADNDTLTATGTSYAELFGEAGADSLLGGEARDTLEGGSGLDTITGAGGLDVFEGSATDLNGDRITDYTAGEKIYLNQNLTSAAQVQLEEAANGTDTELRIDADNNGSFETVLTLSGTVTGNIVLTSQDGYTNNVIRIAPAATGNGPDSAVGSAQDDTISTLGGNDTIVAGEGNDTVNGGADDDLVNGGAGDDSIDGGDGTADTVLLGGPWSDYAITESGGIYTIVDQEPDDGDEGTDTVSNVERIAFNGSAVTTFAIADALNDTPVLDNEISDRTATQGTAFSLLVDANFSDADAPLGDSLMLEATQADGTALPSWLEFDATTGSFSGTPGNGDVGTLSVKVTATDNAGASVSDSFDIAVGNINDAPTITSNGGNATAAVSVPENSTAAVTTVAATDPDAGQTLSYALAGGADAAKFSVNSSTGALIFRAAPDYEKPSDVGRNNVYDVTVQVSDGSGGTDTQALAVRVTDVADGGKPPANPATATEGNDTLTGTSKADTFNGLGGNDVISGAGGNDTLSGGAGSDRLTGGAGADLLTGGTEADTFIFAAASDSRHSASDTIADFKPVDDTIDLRGLGLADGSNDVFPKGVITPLSGTSANFFKDGGTQFDVAYGQSGSDTFVYVDAHGDGSFKTNQDMVIKLANFTGALTDGDFLLA